MFAVHPVRTLRPLLAASIALVFSVSAFAAEVAPPAANLDTELQQCTFVPHPTVADGATASDEQMADLAGAMRQYVAAIQHALDCVDDVQKQLGVAITPEQRAVINQRYNNGIDQMNANVAAYNAQVRIYKERSDTAAPGAPAAQ